MKQKLLMQTTSDAREIVWTHQWANIFLTLAQWAAARRRVRWCWSTRSCRRAWPAGPVSGCARTASWSATASWFRPAVAWWKPAKKFKMLLPKETPPSWARSLTSWRADPLLMLMEENEGHWRVLDALTLLGRLHQLVTVDSGEKASWLVSSTRGEDHIAQHYACMCKNRVDNEHWNPFGKTAYLSLRYPGTVESGCQGKKWPISGLRSHCWTNKRVNIRSGVILA